MEGNEYRREALPSSPFPLNPTEEDGKREGGEGSFGGGRADCFGSTCGGKGPRGRRAGVKLRQIDGVFHSAAVLSQLVLKMHAGVHGAAGNR